MKGRSAAPLPTWRLGLGVTFLIAAAAPLLFPPPTAAPLPSFGNEPLLERLFPGTPGEWVVGRLLCLLAAASCVVTRGAADLFTNPSPGTTEHPDDSSRQGRLRFAVGAAAFQLAAAPTIWWMSRDLQLLFVAWLAVPTLILIDWHRLGIWLRRRGGILASLLSISLVWIALRAGISWRSPRVADVLDDWRGMQLLELAFAPTFNLLIDRTMGGAGTSFHFFLQGAGWGEWFGIGPTFATVQISQFVYLAIAATMIGWIALRTLGLAAAIVACTAFLFSPFNLMVLLTPLPMFYGPLVNAGLVLLLLLVRYDGSLAAFAAFSFLAGVALTWHGSLLMAAALFPIAIWTAWFHWRLPPAAFALAALSASTGMVSAIPDLIDMPVIAAGYSHSRAQWIGHELAGFGQIARLTSEYLLESASVHPIDIPLSAILTPFATPRTPMRLVGDVLFDPWATSLLACGLPLALVAAPKSWAARVILLTLALGLAPLTFASTDRVSLNRFLAASVAVALLAGVGFAWLRQNIARSGRSKRHMALFVTAASVACCAASGIFVFDHANPRLLYSSWSTIAFEAIGDAPATQHAVLLDHPKPLTFPQGYLADITRAVAPDRAYAVAFDLTLDGDPLAGHEDAQVYIWNPALEEELRVSEVLCSRWSKELRLYELYDAAHVSRAFAAAPRHSDWKPQLVPTRWSEQACDVPLRTEATWAAKIIEEATQRVARGDAESARSILREAALHNFANVPLFVATANALRDPTGDDDRDTSALAEAVFWARRAVKAARGRDLRSALLLADLQAETGDLDGAVATLESTRRYAESEGDGNAIGRLDRAIASYRNRPQDPKPTAAPPDPR